MTRPLLAFAIAALLLHHGILRGVHVSPPATRAEYLDPQDLRLELVAWGLNLPVAEVLIDAADRYDLDPHLVARVIEVESDWDPGAVNVNADGSTDGGLMQLNDSTWPWASRMAGVEGSDRMDPLANIRAGIWYLAYLRDHVGDGHEMATAYNRGPTGLERHRETTGTAVTAYSRRILEVVRP